MPIDFAKGIATQALNNGLRKVAGNVPGLLGKIRGKDGVRDSSDLKDLNNTKTSGVSPKLLQFPLDIDSDPGVGNHGHYIIFYINEFEKTKLKFGDFAPEGQGAINLQIEEAQRKLQSKIKQVIQNGGFPESITEEELKKQGGSFQYDSKNFIKMENIQNQFKDDTLIQRRQGYGYSQLNHSEGSNTNNETRQYGSYQEYAQRGQSKVINNFENNVRVALPSRKRLDTAIALYMPAQVQVTYGAKFTDTEISPFAGAIGTAVADLSAGASVSDTYNKVIPQVTEGLTKRALLKGLDILDALGVSGAREAIEIGRAEVIADRMQLAFKGVDRRAFQYTFKMIPRNSREADSIRKIVDAFKFNMMPEYKKGKKRDTLNYPATFNIEYHYRGKENTYLNRVSECFLENVQVTYGGDRYKTFDPHNSEGAPPVETSIVLAFKEIETMHRERIAEGF